MASKGDTDRSGLRDLSRNSGDVANYYDEWAEDYDQTLARWRYQAPEQAATRLREVLDTDAVVLDAGCGTGLSGKALAAAGFKAIDGIDVSSKSLEIADKLGVYRTLRRVDMQRLPLPIDEDGYDGLVSVGVLTYLPDSQGIMREFCRVLRPGGRMVITQRTDILEERDFPSVLEKLENDGWLSEVRISEPAPYLPENEEFADQIKVHYISCRCR